jgi:hypothetical protein
MALSGAEKMARLRARQLQNAERLRRISAQVAKLVRNEKHSAEDEPIVRQLEKTLRSITI